MNSNNRLVYTYLTDDQVLAILRYELSRRTNHSNTPIGQDLILMDEVATRFASLMEQNELLNEEVLTKEMSRDADDVESDKDEASKRDSTLEMIQKEADFELASMDGETKPKYESIDEFLDHMKGCADQLDRGEQNPHFVSSAIRAAIEGMKEIR